MAKDLQKTLYLTENVASSDGTGGISVPPPMMLCRVSTDFTGQVVLNYNQGHLGRVEKLIREAYKPVELTDRGFQPKPEP